MQEKSLAKQKSCAVVYRYGFNGKENDNEVKGQGNSQDYGMRVYDPRLGKFLSVDPLTKKYPELTPYQFASNRPIDCIDLDGLEGMGIVRPYQQNVGVDEPVTPGGVPYGVLNLFEQQAFERLNQPRRTKEEIEEDVRRLNDPESIVETMEFIRKPQEPSTTHFETDAMGGTRTAPNVYLLRPATSNRVASEQQQINLRTTNAASNSSPPAPRVNAQAGGGAKVENIWITQQRQIQEMADKWQIEIIVIGSRARGTANRESDWDYIVSEVKETMMHDLKFRLPKSPASSGEMGRSRIEIFNGNKTKLNENLPFIKFTPNPPPQQN